MQKLFKKNSFLLISLILSFSLTTAFSQPPRDKELIINRTVKPITPIERTVHFGFNPDANWFVKYNPLSIVASCLMYFYQKTVSTQLSATCGYSPTCSEMSKLLIQRYGLFKGVFCTADRLTRCNKIVFTEFAQDELDPENGKKHEDTDRYK